MMPGLSGIDVVERIRNSPAGAYRYVLLLTSKSDRRAMLEGLTAGVDDYLVKPFDAAELQARLRGGERVLALQDRLLAAYERAQFQADHDGLTALFNHKTILQILQSERARAMRDASSVGIIMIDVDHFKQVNDTYGHPAGDDVLTNIADVIRRTVREYDSVGRYGGEEFLVVTPHCELVDVLNLAERLRVAVAQHTAQTRTAKVAATISLGVVVGSKETVEELLHVADAALYRAKQAGRNRVEDGGRPGQSDQQIRSEDAAQSAHIESAAIH
jgi:diguanylate cyclase (GGDEF)-like protein